MPGLPRTLERALRRRTIPWNWGLRALGLALLALSLGTRGALAFSTGAILAAASLFDLHLPPAEESATGRLLARASQRDAAWRAAPWTRRKRAEALALALLAGLLLWSLFARDLGLGLVAVAGAALAGAWAAQSASDRWTALDDETPTEDEEQDDEDAASLMEDELFDEDIDSLMERMDRRDRERDGHGTGGGPLLQ
jgi:hypothetical protein